MEEHDFGKDPNDPWHSVNGLETYYLTKDVVAKKNIWSQSSHANSTNMGALLCGFFTFYSGVFPEQIAAASIRFGKIGLAKTCLHQTSKVWRLCVEGKYHERGRFL